MFQDIVAYASQHKNFYRIEIQKINGATEVFGLQHQFYQWNNLPRHVKRLNSIISFKKNLKTHLFLEAFKSL